MIRAIDPSPVPPEEVARRIVEMRQIAWEHRGAPVVVYHIPHHPCPWPDCDLHIAGITFHLDGLRRPDLMDAWLKAWWLGPGLVARCPACNRHVLFDVVDKKAVPDPASVDAPILPDDWHRHAHVVSRPAPGWTE